MGQRRHRGEGGDDGEAAASAPRPPETVTADLGPGAAGFFTTRAGGVSSGPYAAPDGAGGLNLGFHVQDDPDRVLANRDLVDRMTGVHVAWMSQRHGARVRVVARPPGPGRTTLGECDALVGDAGPRAVAGPDQEAPALGVMVADCVPLLLADVSGRLTAAVHVGRAGLTAGIAAAAVAELAARGARTGEIHASLGPSICGRCYEVPAELRDEVAAVAPAAMSRTSWGTPALDIPAALDRQLRLAGLRHIEVHDVCTLEDPRFYSYRRSRVTGRFAGVVRGRPT